jgi:hypothetical protein
MGFAFAQSLKHELFALLMTGSLDILIFALLAHI